MPVGDAVKLMASRVTEPSLRALCRGLWRDLSEGRNLSAALAKRPVVFDEATVRLVEAGEATGSLVPVLNRVRESYGKREELRSRVLAALGYPVLLTLMATGVLGLFVFVIMPIMEKMMVQLGGKFPWYVKALMAAATFVVKGSPIILVVLALVFFRLKKAREDVAVKRAQDAFALKIPLAGKAMVHAEASRLADLLSTLLGSGVNAAQALRLAERPVSNSELRARFGDARRRVHDGTAISVALKDTRTLRAGGHRPRGGRRKFRRAAARVRLDGGAPARGARRRDRPHGEGRHRRFPRGRRGARLLLPRHHHHHHPLRQPEHHGPPVIPVSPYFKDKTTRKIP